MDSAQIRDLDNFGSVVLYIYIYCICIYNIYYKENINKMRRRSRERDGLFQNFLFLCLKKVMAIEENKKRCKGLRTSKSRTNVSTENNHSTHEKLKKIVNPTQPAVRSE